MGFAQAYDLETRRALVVDHVTVDGLADGVTLTARPGEAVAITGPPGSGKTTLLCVFGGFIAPSRGRIIRPGRVLGVVVPAYKAGATGSAIVDHARPGDLVLTDEPTGGCNPAGVLTVLDYLDAIRSTGAIVVATTHDPTLTAWAHHRIDL